LRNRIDAPVAALVFAGLLASGAASAAQPSVADLDAAARASGNRIDVATRIGESIFSATWPAQVSQISANALDAHLVIGIRVWGVKFHHPVTREEFVDEVVALVEKAFAAAPDAEEVDVWASVPIEVGRGVDVNGDLAKPTSRTVFSLTVRRGGEAPEQVARATAAAGAFWDEEWARAAFKNQGT
jgi:hypothetical protein